MNKYFPGVILVSKNIDESLNTTPKSIWNHLSIMISETELIESQINQGVIITKFEDYKKRAYTWGIIYPKQKSIGLKAANYAKELVGIKYRKFSSIFKNPRPIKRGLNCVSVVRESYSKILGYDIFIRVPDELLLQKNIFTDKLSEVKD